MRHWLKQLVTMCDYYLRLSQEIRNLGSCLSIERSMLVGEQFIKLLIRKYWEHNISTDGGTCYPQASRFLNIEYHNQLFLDWKKIHRKDGTVHNKTQNRMFWWLFSLYKN